MNSATIGTHASIFLKILGFITWINYLDRNNKKIVLLFFSRTQHTKNNVRDTEHEDDKLLLINLPVSTLAVITRALQKHAAR